MKKWFRRLFLGAAVAVPVLLVVGWFSFWPVMLRVMESRAASAEIRLTHVAGQVYMIDAILEGRQVGASAAASVGGDGILLVDSMTAAGLAEKARAALTELPAGDGRYLVNTHAHPDHVLGNSVFATQGKIVAHAATRRRLSEPTKPVKWLPAVPPFPAESLPEDTLTGRESVTWNGEEVVLLPLAPAHTDGDVAVYFTASNVVHVGDVFNGRGGRSVADYGYGGDLDGLAAALDRLGGLLPEDVRVICGHGGIGAIYSRQDLVTYHGILVEMLDLLRQRLRAGKTVEEVVAENLTARWNDYFGAAREDSVMHDAEPTEWVRALYTALAEDG